MDFIKRLLSKNNIMMALMVIIIIIIAYYSIAESFEESFESYTNDNNITTNQTVDQQHVGQVEQKPQNIKWGRNQCKYLMTDTLLDELKSAGLTESEKNWDIFFPCVYDDIVDEVKQMPVVNGAKYFVLENCDEIVAKELLWKNVVDYYDYQIAKTMMPNSYILYDNADMARFAKEFDENKIYIMKKNIQRQEGLKITKDKNEIMSGYEKGGYVLVQELLQNPYIISGRKTNMRFYTLVVCKDNNMNVYVYKDGFMYYTKDLFKSGSLEEGPNITTGYIDRQVYVDNPLTHQDLMLYLDNPNRTLLESERNVRNQGLKVSQVYFNKIYHLIGQIFIAFQGKLNNMKGIKKFNSTNTTFQLFGIDIAVDNKLNPTIMEVNKGPDLGAKDERDSALKHGAVRDMLKIIGAAPMSNCSETKYIKVLSITNGNIGTDNAASCSL